MPFTCPVCGNEDYNVDDGGFFCTECGTQSQEYIVQEASDLSVYDPGQSRHEVQVGRDEGNNRKPKASLGRPWTVYEAFQIIIMAQAEALTACGASKDLKDVTYTLWANYLSKLGIAFCAKEHIVPNVVEKYKIGRPREIFRGTIEKPLNLKKQPVTKRKRAKRKSSDEEEPPGKKQRQVTAEKAEPFKPSDVVFINDSCFSNTKIQHSRLRKAALNSPEWMSLKKTIALCYIGVLLTTPDILPCDVVRWIYEGRVPYLSTSHCLPEDMVLSNFDSFLFSVDRLDTDSLLQEVNKLNKFLGLKDLPLPNLCAITTRFVKELCLPDEFSFFAQRLIKNIPFQWNSERTSYKRSEELAFGYIILALKIIFGLDDISERKLSEGSRELQTMLQPEIKLFNWSEWKCLLTERQNHRFDAYSELTSDLSSSQLESMDELLRCHVNLNLDKRRLSTRYLLSSKGRQVRHYDPEFRDLLKRPLSAAIASNGLENQHNDLERVRRSGWSTKGDELKKSTVSHIVDIPSFKTKIQSLEEYKKQKCHDLLAKISTRPKFVVYKFLEASSELVSNRHRSYHWLLNLASDTCCCQPLALDKTVVRLSEYFYLLSQGECMKGIKCSKSGSFKWGSSRHQNIEDGMDGE